MSMSVVYGKERGVQSICGVWEGVPRDGLYEKET